MGLIVGEKGIGMNYKQVHEIEINEDEKVIKFTKTHRKTECEHSRVIISTELNEIECKDCQAKINPVWWISNKLERLNAVNDRNNAILSEYREIFKKLDSKRNFMCKKCHEVNEIDFKKLPSKAAVQRGISVVESDYKGWSVEI